MYPYYNTCKMIIPLLVIIFRCDKSKKTINIICHFLQKILHIFLFSAVVLDKMKTLYVIFYRKHSIVFFLLSLIFPNFAPSNIS